MADDQKGLLLLGVLGLGGLALWERTRYSDMMPSQLIDPGAVSALAASLPSGDDYSFAMAAWGLVADNVLYEDVGSDLFFTNNHIRCDGCLTPQQVLSRGEANCVGRSALLTSLLRNRFPPERVYMALGRLNLDGVGGHAWAELKSDGEWYILESTTQPTAKWLKVRDNLSTYVPQVLFNDVTKSECNGTLCAVTAGCDCLGAFFGHT